jgi:hypothetical protein
VPEIAAPAIDLDPLLAGFRYRLGDPVVIRLRSGAANAMAECDEQTVAGWKNCGMPPVADAEQLRLVELLGAISLATDPGTGQPHLHGVRTSVLAVSVGRELGVGDAAVADVQQVALLRFLGCTADAAQTARMTGGDDLAFLGGWHRWPWAPNRTWPAA